jgi:hypothetical protein
VLLSLLQKHNARDALLSSSLEALCSRGGTFGRYTQCSSHILQCELIESDYSTASLSVLRQPNFFII